MSTGIANEPGSREPGLDALIRALTADAHPHELAGRDAALAAFRATRSQPRRQAGFRVLPGAPARLSTVAAALVAAFAGLTAAAYAKALPAPMQHIAYDVGSPFGVPDTQPTPAPHARPKPKPHHSASAQAPHKNPSPPIGPTCPCHTPSPRRAIKGSTLALSAARQELPANGWDEFAGRLTYHGRPEPDVRIQLLEQTAGASDWVLAGTGVTGGRGRVRVVIPHVLQNATFQLAGPNGVASATISVTVIPHVGIWRAPAQPGTNRLVVQSLFGDVGDTVVLQRLSSGTWNSVATAVLNANHRASFDLPAKQSGGHYYRIELQATSAHDASVSGSVFEPKVTDGTGAKSITPRPTPTPTGTGGRGGHGHGSPTPTPTPTGPVTPGPVPTGPVTPGPVTPGPTPTGPVTPGPVTPGPVPTGSATSSSPSPSSSSSPSPSSSSSPSPTWPPSSTPPAG